MVGHSVPKANLRVLDHLIGARHELAQVSNLLKCQPLRSKSSVACHVHYEGRLPSTSRKVLPSSYF